MAVSTVYRPGNYSHREAGGSCIYVQRVSSIDGVEAVPGPPGPGVCRRESEDPLLLSRGRPKALASDQYAPGGGEIYL